VLIDVLVNGVLGAMDDSLLEKQVHVTDNEVEYTEATEYRFNGELVHRSAHVHLKRGLSLEQTLGSFN
jgi:hypothetical protein